MKITGITTEDLRNAVAKVNAVTYEGNINIENLEQVSKNRISVKLGTRDSRAFGSRQAASGRHGKWLCWHGFRDVFDEVLNINPEARIYTGIESYKGREDFEDKFPETAYTNKGSLFQPVDLADLCNC